VRETVVKDSGGTGISLRELVRVAIVIAHVKVPLHLSSSHCLSSCTSRPDPGGGLDDLRPRIGDQFYGATPRVEHPN
jgi:hypothetical protein